MTRWNTDAIVLATRPQGESDLWVDLITPGQGRISALAKGALRSMKRFAGVFDLARVIAAGLMIAPRSGLPMIEHAAVRRSFPEFSQGPLRLARASLLVEIATGAVGENEPAPAIYELLLQGLASQAAEPDSDRWAVVFAFRMLMAAGYRPELSECVSCQGECHGRELVFSTAAGGLVCPECAGRPSHETGRSKDGCVEVTVDAVRTITAIMDAPLGRLPQLHRRRGSFSLRRRNVRLTGREPV